MTKDEIQALAYKAQIKPMLVDGRWGITNMEVFVDLLLKEEREACAVAAEMVPAQWDYPVEIPHPAQACQDCAAAIRARGQE
jgi:hypothetical protein